ncbi:sensor histidine kinase [Dyadobacter luticola]|nr:sensor histidine kinase [Dyadobacter luticola]
MQNRFQQLLHKPLPYYLPALFHGMVWLIYLLSAIYINNYQGVNFLIGHPSIHLVAEMIVFYANYSYFIPTLLAKMKVPRFLLLNVATILVLVTIFIPAYHSLRNWYLGPDATLFPLSYDEQFVLRSFELLMFAGIACIVRFSVDWFSFQQKTRELENAYLKTELAFLRSQLNPHFLFNTLNALYGLAIKQSVETSAGIMRLSQLMRYVLYETNNDQIGLAKEVEMIEHFLELQRLRLPLDFPVHFEIQGDVENIFLEPLLLMPIVENVFKHGSGFASISLSVTESSIRLLTDNGIGTKSMAATGGIGLANLERRLLHLYPDRHQLYFNETNKSFQTTLSLTF